MRAKLGQVAELLGGTITMSESDTCGVITLADGVRFWVVTNRYGLKGRIQFDSYWPHTLDRYGHIQTIIQRSFDRALKYDSPVFQGITVSELKTAEQIAKDIERRFLPEYKRLFALAVGYVEDTNAYNQAKENTTALITAMIRELHTTDGAPSISADYFGRDTADIKINSLTVAEVEALCGFLKMLRAKS